MQPVWRITKFICIKIKSKSASSTLRSNNKKSSICNVLKCPGRLLEAIQFRFERKSVEVFFFLKVLIKDTGCLVEKSRDLLVSQMKVQRRTTHHFKGSELKKMDFPFPFVRGLKCSCDKSLIPKRSIREDLE